MADKDQKQKQINIELDEKMAEGIYSNLAIINHSVSEFVVDFISMMPGAPKAKVKSRIVLTPQHAKKFLKALSDNVNRFEKAHGTIKDYEQPPIPLNFGPCQTAFLCFAIQYINRTPIQNVISLKDTFVESFVRKIGNLPRTPTVLAYLLPKISVSPFETP